MYNFEIILLLFVQIIIGLLATAEITNISFPRFSANDSDIKAYGDIQFNAKNHSWIMNAKSANTSTGTCAMLMYSKNNFKILDSATGRTAPFSTSFTFKFTIPPNRPIWNASIPITSPPTEPALMFYLTKSTTKEASTGQDMGPFNSQPGGCQPMDSSTHSSVAVMFRIVYNPLRNELSNNFIAINDRGNSKTGFPPASIYNLCGGNQTHCSYLSGGGIFTAWIDFTPQQTLQVRLVNGSHLHTDKPLNPLFEYLSFKLPTTMGDYFEISLVGSSREVSIEAHELYSWNFYSGGIQEAISSSKNIWIGPTFGALGALATFLVIGCLSWRYAKHCRVVAFNYASGPRKFSYKELCIATKDFSGTEKLGSGAFGTVYKGSFQSQGRAILLAVKRLNFESKHAEATFSAEISSLSQIRHGNVVQLQGWCHEKGRLLLVYDYMSNGGLDEWLHDAGGGNGGRRGVLSLRARHRILVGVAVALEYLHKDCPQCVLHRDIKSSNVMLDADLKAHLGDFGLARLMDHKKLDTTTMAAGTIGYMAPELPYTGKATKASDVYSLGILILEVLSGRRPIINGGVRQWNVILKPLSKEGTLDMRTSAIHELDHEDTITLLNSAWEAHETGTYLDVVDGRLIASCIQLKGLQGNSSYIDTTLNLFSSSASNFVKDNKGIKNNGIEESNMMIIKNLLNLGLCCCLPNHEVRPTMEQVVRILQQIGNISNADFAMSEVSMPLLPKANPMEVHFITKFSQST